MCLLSTRSDVLFYRSRVLISSGPFVLRRIGVRNRRSRDLRSFLFTFVIVT
jgi:hypothetical protein